MVAKLNSILCFTDFVVAAESSPLGLLPLTEPEGTTWRLSLHALRVGRCAVFVRRGEDRWMVVEARRTPYPLEQQSGIQLSLRCVTASDVQALPLLENQMDGEEFKDFGVGSDQLVVPLLLGNHVCGFLQASERTVSVPFAEDDLITLQLVGRYVPFWLRNILAVSKDDHSAVHIDYLTNLYNYRYFCKRLKTELLQAELLHQPLSLLMIDLDEYKQINDTYGHQIGNAVLVQIASLLRLAVRDTDVVCRYGGDEFAVILPHSGEEEALTVARRLKASLKAKQVSIPGTGLISTPGLTIGVSTFPIPASSGEELIRQADQALYAGKGGLPGMPQGFNEEKVSAVP